MPEVLKPKRPIFSIVLAILLIFKLLSGFSIISKLVGLEFSIVLAQLVMLLIVIYSMNSTGGGVKMIRVMVGLTLAIMLLDFAFLALAFSDREMPAEVLPRAIGAELTYLITVCYLFFSKKFRLFKSFETA